MKIDGLRDNIAATAPKAGWLFALGFVIAVAGCAETPSQRAQRIEPMLSAAGFRLHPADTPERQDNLKLRTPLKVRYSIRPDGNVYYWFADPVVCQCLYVGNQANYQKYEQLRLQQRAADQAQATAAMNEDAALQEQTDFMMWPAPVVW